MITGISIKNFKGIGDPGIKIDLAPVTLLLGINNAGKSSIFHAFMLADEIFNRGNRNPSRIGPEGSSIDLGGFENFVNAKDRTKSVELTFRLDLSRTKLDAEWRIEETLIELCGNPAGVDPSTIGDDVWTGVITVRLSWDEKTNTSFVSRYSVALNDEHLLDIDCPSPRSVIFPTNVNPAHSLFRWPEGSENEVGITSYGVLDGLVGDFQHTAVSAFHLASEFSANDLPPQDDEGYVKVWTGAPQNELEEVRILVPAHDYEDLPEELLSDFDEIGSFAPELQEVELYFARYASGLIQLAAVRILSPVDLDNEEAKEEADRLIEEWFDQMNRPHSFVSILSQRDALPNWHEPIKFKFPFADFPQFESLKSHIRLATELLNRLIVVPGRILARELASFRHVGPLRKIPERSYRVATFNDRFRWTDGLAAWDSLLRSSRLTSDVSEWICREDRLGLGYEADFQEFREVPIDHLVARCFTADDSFNLDMLQIAAEAFEQLPTRTRVRFRSELSPVLLDAQDLAVGLNQVLPVVVAALDDHVGLTLIEQPELHNHPSVEVGLGDLFAQTIRDNTCRFLLETHSEHLLLRMLRRIRETNEGELPEGIPPLDPESIAVYFIENSPQGVSAKRLRIDQTGEFIDKWPGGFFAERAGELF